MKGLAEKRILRGHDRFVPAIAFSHDSKLLTTVSKDKTAKLWNADTGELLHEFRLEGVAQAVAFSPDDQLLAFGEYSGNLTIYDVRTRERLAIRKMDSVLRLAFTPDGKLISAGGSGLSVFDVVRQDPGDGGVATVELELRDRSREFTSWCASVSPDGRWVVFAKHTQMLGLWDLKEGREVDRFPQPRLLLSGWHNATFLPDSQHVIFIANNGKPQVWNIMTGQIAFEIAHTRNFLDNHIALSPNGRWLAGTATGEALTIVDLQSRRELFTLGEELASIKSVAWSPDGRRIAAGLINGGVVIWDFAEIRKQLGKIGLGSK